MKKVLLVIAMFVLGVCATQAFGQVTMQGRSVLVQPPAYNVRVNVPQYYRVQPQPYVVTPHLRLPPPKPNFWTPVRNFFWRSAHPARIHYHVQPYNPGPGYQPMPYRMR